MGYIRDHAIVVVGTYGDALEKARAEAVRIFASDASPFGPPTAAIGPSEITPPAVNGSQAFFIPPDGSKEGWTESGNGDDRRKAFLDYLDSTKYDDGSSALKWVEVRVSDDNDELAIERSHVTK